MNYTLSVSGNVLTIAPSGALLNYNTQYTVTIAAGLSGYYDIYDYELASDYIFWFTSQYCPLFTTLNRVKLAAGPYAEQYTDDTIYRMIHRNSMDIIDIYNISYSTNYAYDSQGCDPSGAPYAFRRYVECKTAYDLLSLLKLNGSLDGTSGGDQLKTLGDMTIKYGGAGSSAGAFRPDQNKLKELYDCWNEQLRMIKTIKTAVKGFYSTSKGYLHPTRDIAHNRIIRGVSFNNSYPGGPWENAPEWIGYYNGRYPSGPGRY